MLEEENDDLKSRISDLMNDRSALFQQPHDNSALHMCDQELGLGKTPTEEAFDARKNIPKLHIKK